MKNLLLLLQCATALCCTALFAQKPVTNYGRLQVNGSHVTAENGDKISLAGMSLFWSTAGDVSDFYNDETVSFLANDWGASLVRIPMGVKESWDGGNGYIDSPTAQKTKIKKVIDAAIANDIYVIVDWHSHNAEAYTTEAAQFFSEIAEEYGTNDHIIYEVYNEPIGQSWNTIKSYAETVIAAIRAKDPDNLIIVGTGFYSQEVTEPASNPINDVNVAYTLHFYAGTHKQSLRNTAAQAMNSGVPLFVTEWGTVSADGNGGVDTSETEKWVQFMQDNNISHANWTLGDKNESSCIIKPQKGVNGFKNGDLTQSGLIVKEIIEDQQPTLSSENLAFTKSQQNVYPNPTSDNVTISKDLVNEEYLIADTSGKILEVNSIEQNTINFANYPKGVYVLQLKKKGKVIATELVTRK